MASSTCCGVAAREGVPIEKEVASTTKQKRIRVLTNGLSPWRFAKYRKICRKTNDFYIAVANCGAGCGRRLSVIKGSIRSRSRNRDRPSERVFKKYVTRPKESHPELYSAKDLGRKVDLPAPEILRS